MIYLIAASIPAEIQYAIPGDKEHGAMLFDILCSRWIPAFKKAKKLKMPTEFQSQLYINAKYHFKSIKQCPATIPTPHTPVRVMRYDSNHNSSQNSSQNSNKGGSYVPSSSSIWGGIFK